MAQLVAAKELSLAHPPPSKMDITVHGRTSLDPIIKTTSHQMLHSMPLALPWKDETGTFNHKYVDLCLGGKQCFQVERRWEQPIGRRVQSGHILPESSAHWALLPLQCWTKLRKKSIRSHQNRSLSHVAVTMLSHVVIQVCTPFIKLSLHQFMNQPGPGYEQLYTHILLSDLLRSELLAMGLMKLTAALLYTDCLQTNWEPCIKRSKSWKSSKPYERSEFVPRAKRSSDFLISHFFWDQILKAKRKQNYLDWLQSGSTKTETLPAGKKMQKVVE